MKNPFAIFPVLFLLCGLLPPAVAVAEKNHSIPAITTLLLPSKNDDYATALKREMTAVMTEHNIPGISMAIKFPDSSIFLEAVGVASRTTGEPLSPHHYFRIGSASKTITATAALLLYQDGHYDLDDLVEDLLPNLVAFQPMHGKGITVRMLLQHYSGLVDYVNCPYEKDHEFEGFVDELVDNPLKDWSPEELVDLAVKNTEPESPVDQEWLYSNTNYILLGLLIEKFSGMSYEQFVQENIFALLNLENTSAPQTEKIPEPYAHGYLEKDSDGTLHDYTRQNPSGVWAAGNVISTVPDLLVWLETLIKGRLLVAEVHQEQFTFRSSFERDEYGLGVASVKKALGHNGSVLGYQTWMFFYRDTYFVIYNNCYYLSGDTGHISKMLFERVKKILFPKE